VEWTVVTVVIALVGLVVAVLTPAIKLNTSVTKLSTVVDTLTDQLKGMELANNTEHDKLTKRLDSQGETINDHETRITVLERRE